MNNIEVIVKILREALNNNDIAVVKCFSQITKYPEQDILCAVNKSNENIEYIPLVALIDNPYKSLSVKSIEWTPTRTK